MHPAHLDRLLDALPHEARPGWRAVLQYIAAYAVSGVFFGSIKSFCKGAPHRSPLKLSEPTVERALLMLENWGFIKRIGSVDGSAVTNQIHLLGQNQAIFDEKVFALSRPGTWARHRLARNFWAAVERRRSSQTPNWDVLAEMLRSEELELRHLLSDEFLGIQYLPGVEPEPNRYPGGATTSNRCPGGATTSAKSLPTPVSSRATTSPSEGGLSSSALVKAFASGSALDQGSLGLVGFFPGSDGGGAPMKSDEVAAQEKKAKADVALEELKKSGALSKASGKKATPKAEQRKDQKRKSTTTRQQVLKGWSAWVAVKPLLELYYGKGCIVTVQPQVPVEGSVEPQELVLVEMQADIDLKASNPDAVKTLEVLNSTKSFLFGKAAIEAPKNAMKAWIAYARLFHMPYQGKGSNDQRAALYFRTLVRRLSAAQQKILPEQILPRMGGFVFRMDHMRRNKKTQYYPSQDWADIYDVTKPRYLTAWADAMLCGHKDAMAYMGSIKPFVEPTTLDGEEILPPPPTPAERLATLRKELQEWKVRCQRNYDETNSPGAWDKLSENDKILRAIGLLKWTEMQRLEKELASDPAHDPVRQQ